MMLDFLSFLLQDQIGSAVQLFRWDSMHTDRQDARIINFVWLLHLLDRFCFQKCRYVFQFSDTLGTFACQSANGARLIFVLLILKLLNIIYNFILFVNISLWFLGLYCLYRRRFFPTFFPSQVLAYKHLIHA